MSTETKVTRGVRVRRYGKKGTWLIARDAASGKVRAQGRSKSANSNGSPKTEVMIRELIAEKNLEAQEVDVLVITGSDRSTLEKAQSLIELMGERLGDLENSEMERLIDTAMPSLFDRPSRATIDQARRNAEIRASFLRSYEVLDAEQIHELYGSTAKNRAALAARWRADGKIFAIEHQSRLLYPAFQFDDQGKPKPILARVLEALGDGVGPWQTAIWFTTGNPWLGGQKPVDLLEVEPERVEEAAFAIAEPVEH